MTIHQNSTVLSTSKKAVRVSSIPRCRGRGFYRLHVLSAHYQPRHAREIHGPFEAAPKVRIVRSSGKTLPVSDINQAHLPSVAFEECGQVPMHVVEVGECEERVSAEAFQPATGVPGAVAENAPPDGVRRNRGPAFPKCILPADALPRDQSDAHAQMLSHRCDQTADFLRWILTVAVNR